ncbi:MAG: type II toxin-antitoxin system HicB family antitoxin [Candidatus Binataceae bacterium]
MTFKIETEREEDGRWIADVVDLPCAMADGTSATEAIAHASALALRILAARIEHDEASASDLAQFSVAV